MGAHAINLSRPLKFTSTLGTWVFNYENIKTTQLIEAAATAKLSIIDLPGGAIFDPTPSGQVAPIGAQDFTFSIYIDGETGVSPFLWGQAYLSAVGISGTFESIAMDGEGNAECTARCKSVSANHYGMAETQKMEINYTFTRLSEWTISP